MNFDNYSCDNQMSIFDFTREPISITKPIRLIELFAGYGSQAMALKRIGAKFEHYRVVEFDKYAIASYNAVHGTDFPTMDITKVHAEDLNICDTNTFTYLLTYSFPCTDLSVAGKQAGMSKGSGTRSGLLWEVERILTEIERCFMFSFLGEYNYHFPQPIPLKKKLKDYLEDNVDEKYYINNEKADKLIKQLIDNGTLPQHNLDRQTDRLALTEQSISRNREKLQTVYQQGTITEFQNAEKLETSLSRMNAMLNYNHVDKIGNDVAKTLCARDYKGFGTGFDTMNGVIEWSQ